MTTRAVPSLKKDFKISFCFSLMSILFCWITWIRFLKSYKIFKMWETTNIRAKNPRFNRFVVWCAAMTKTAHHTNTFLTKSPGCEHGKPFKISWDLRIKMFYRTRCINTPAVAPNRQVDLPSLLSKCFCALPRLCLLCFHLLSARFLIGYCLVSHDNLQIIRAFVLGVPPTSGFLIINIQCWIFTIRERGASDFLPSRFSHS